VLEGADDLVLVAGLQNRPFVSHLGLPWLGKGLGSR
jgi:hypothetical protein